MKIKKPVVNFLTLGTLVGFSIYFLASVLAGRPLSTEDAGIVAKGKFELELGGDHIKCRCHVRENCLGFVLKYGVTGRLDFGIEMPFLLLKPVKGRSEGGISDLAIGFKYCFLEGRDRIPALALRADIRLPTGDQNKELGSGTIDYLLLGIATGARGPATAHFNIGCVFSHDPNSGAGVEKVLCYGMALEYSLGERFGLVGEIQGETNPGLQISAAPLCTLGGMTYELKPGMVFDVGLNLGLTQANPRYTLTVGLTLTSE